MFKSTLMSIMLIKEKSSYALCISCAAVRVMLVTSANMPRRYAMVTSSNMPCTYAKEDQAKRATKRNENDNSIQETIPRGPFTIAGRLHLASLADSEVLLLQQEIKFVSAESSY